MSTTEVDEKTAAEGPGDEQKEKPRLTLEVKVDKPSACQRHVTVAVSREDIDRYFKQAFDDLPRSWGHRRGPAPARRPAAACAGSVPPSGSH